MSLRCRPQRGRRSRVFILFFCLYITYRFLFQAPEGTYDMVLLPSPRSASSSPVFLIAQWYDEPDASRRSELVQALLANAANMYFEHVYLIAGDPQITWPLTPETLAAASAAPPDTLARLLHERTTMVSLSDNDGYAWTASQRISVGAILKFANENLAASVVVLANADIVFDESIGCAILRHEPHLFMNLFCICFLVHVGISMTMHFSLRRRAEHALALHRTPLARFTFSRAMSLAGLPPAHRCVDLYTAAAMTSS